MGGPTSGTTDAWCRSSRGDPGAAGARLKLEARHDADAAARQQQRAPQRPRHNGKLSATHTVKLAHLTLRRKVRRNPRRGPDQNNALDHKAPLGTKKLEHSANNRKNHQRRRTQAVDAAGNRKDTLPPRVDPLAERLNPRPAPSRTPERQRPALQVPEALPDGKRQRRQGARSPTAPLARTQKPVPLGAPHRNPRRTPKKVPHGLAHLTAKINPPRPPDAPPTRRLGRGEPQGGGAGPRDHGGGAGVR